MQLELRGELQLLLDYANDFTTSPDLQIRSLSTTPTLLLSIMGWFWGAFDGKDGSLDPMRDLDPGLREFLQKESPVKYTPKSTPAAPQASATKVQSSQKADSTANKTSTTDAASKDDQKPKVPPQSLFPDGRYAHLWKTYTPLTEIEDSIKSDAEKIQDVLDAYKYRKAEIGRTALENCAMEQWAVNDCFRAGDLRARMTMCRDENRKLDRCFIMQAKFLKALGYLSTFDRPPEVDEQIQMHADTLYHRMLAQEDAIETAKKEGQPIPTFPPILSTSKPAHIKDTSNLMTEERFKALPLKTQAAMRKRLEGLNAQERLLEERAIKAELELGYETASGLGEIYKRQDEERRQRKEEGKETLSDRITSMLSWR